VTGALHDDKLSLEALQIFMKRLVLLRVVYCLMQLPIVFALLGKWLVAAQAAPGFRTVPLFITKTVGPLAEIAMLLAVVCILFVACVMSIAGPYKLQWSQLSRTAATLVENILASAFRMRLEAYNLPWLYLEAGLSLQGFVPSLTNPFQFVIQTCLVFWSDRNTHPSRFAVNMHYHSH
jgi:hypothetical protein